MKFTKWEWLKAKHSGYETELWLLDDNGVDIDEPILMPRIVTTDGIMELVVDVDNANARLIAAAPALYEACKEAEKHHQGQKSEIGNALRAALALVNEKENV